MSHNPNVRTIYGMAKEPTGFPNRIDTTIAFDSGTRTLTVAPTATQFEYYIKGVKYTYLSPATEQINDTEGLWYFYFDGYSLESSQSFDVNFFQDRAYVAILYWNAADNEAIYFGDERHGLTMDSATHGYLHNLNGAVYINGLGLGDFTVDASGDDDTHAQFSVADGTIYDEDIIHPIEDMNPQALSAIARLPVLYRLDPAGNWRRKTADGLPVIYPGSVASYGLTNTFIAYNNFNGTTWSLQEVSNTNYVLIHVIATNDQDTPVIAILGIKQYNNKNSARNGARVELASFTGLPFAELVPLGTVILEAANSYSNTVKARIVSDDTGADYVDLRPASFFGK
jgi:hypothetical protein